MVLFCFDVGCGTGCYSRLHHNVNQLYFKKREKGSLCVPVNGLCLLVPSKDG